MAYPFYEQLQNLSRNMTGGNFGLWYNKFIPISDFNGCKASDETGDKDNAVKYYHDKYKRFQKDTINQLLETKHRDQAGFCDVFSSRYEIVIFKAKLKTPLITGIGESHPHEVSMVFDHNLGIPYIPASGIKGIVRFAHTLSLLFDENGTFTDEYVEEDNGKEVINEDNEETYIPQLFGTTKNRGKVFFLDAYPEKAPDLHVDIMNPHYGQYYSDDKNQTPPGDYLDPNPLKFLTVAKDTAFIFRALVDKDSPDLADKVKTAFKKALTEEGVGAKTAVGYGIFNIDEDIGKKATEKIVRPEVVVKPVEKLIAAVKALKPSDAGGIGSKIDEALKKLESEEDKKAFAQAVKEHIGQLFKKSKAKEKLAPLLG